MQKATTVKTYELDMATGKIDTGKVVEKVIRTPSFTALAEMSTIGVEVWEMGAGGAIRMDGYTMLQAGLAISTLIVDADLTLDRQAVDWSREIAMRNRALIPSETPDYYKKAHEMIVAAFKEIPEAENRGEAQRTATKTGTP